MTVILITGATGFIGFSVLLAALEAGHIVRYTARSEEKALVVSSNPAIQRLALDKNSLSSVIVPDLTVDGAFDTALEGVTHVIHAGSPVPHPAYNPTTEVFQPTLKISEGLLASALKTPTVKRVIITSSIVGNLPLGPPPATPVSASSRVPLPDPIPSTFDNLFEAYVFGKIIELHNSDEFIKTHHPHFTISHVVPGYVFGRNELALDATMTETQNSSNNFLMMAIRGGEPPYPLYDSFAHIDDVAEVHLRVAFLDTETGPKDFAITTKMDYDTIFDHVKKVFPDAVAAGIFKMGKVIPLPINYDSNDTEQLLGRKFKTFETAVIDVASQYLETAGHTSV
ncbi:putative cinnamoyl-CoA reductase [Xylaria bambusicola]|uniref:putative cinnamoyl-CoA reductase n=1 Tax=Xylaria bambusicola TaxID=326684 RepID=UPI002008E9DD|nr:putative cinnamoyl-CoA reductase [Xylaria bambusicola]KAI0506567.1 putative cinnamoyl-CoA reductase [Xylaria bambusicola]